MKRQILLLLLLAGSFCFLFSSPTQACGHEGWYFGTGYSQLLQYSPNNQLTATDVPSPGRIDFKTRWGGYAKVGYDFCASRWGIELPVSLNRQRLNRSEMVNVIGVDLNALFHIIETQNGIDFYWIGGTGMNIITDGPINNNTGAGGINFNFGPGFQYFFDQKRNISLNFSVPVKYTLYFGSHLSQGHTSVIGIPILAGFTVGFK